MECGLQKGKQRDTGFQESTDPPPARSQLMKDVFVLIIQTEYQWEVF